MGTNVMTSCQRISVAFLVLLAAAGTIHAVDLTTVVGFTYSDATILEVTKTTIKFQLKNETIITKALSEFKKIQTGDLKDFDAAEELAATGKYDKALPLYQAAATNAKGEALAMLCIVRMASAKERAGSSEATSKPTATEPPAKGAKCPLCKGVGTIPCAACTNTGGLATGLSKCGKCLGTGLVTCAKCRGAFGERCNICGGRGHSVKHAANKTGTEESNCTWCGGTGWTDRCTLCFETSHRGKSTCQDCKGTGRQGECSICNGTKRVVCPQCHGEAPKGADTQPAAKAPVSPINIPSKDETLASPDALKLFLQMGAPKHPQKDNAQWGQLTSLAQDEAMEKYHKDVLVWKASRDFKGKNVTWTVALVDVRKAYGGQGYAAKFCSAGGDIIEITIPSASRDEVVAWKKDDRIIVSGKIEEYTITGEGEGIPGERRFGLSIKLVDTSAKLAGK
jgi:hypothetical protein